MSEGLHSDSGFKDGGRVLGMELRKGMVIEVGSGRKTFRVVVDAVLPRLGLIRARDLEDGRVIMIKARYVSYIIILGGDNA